MAKQNFAKTAGFRSVLVTLAIFFATRVVLFAIVLSRIVMTITNNIRLYLELCTMM